MPELSDSDTKEDPDNDEIKAEKNLRIREVEDYGDELEPSKSETSEKSEIEGELAHNEQGSELGPNQADSNESNTEESSEQFDPNESEGSEEKGEFDPNSPDGEVEPEQFDPNESESSEEKEEFNPNSPDEEIEPEQFDPNESSENSNEPDEMGSDEEANYDPYEYGDNFEQEGNSEGYYENYNAESMNTVLLSENLIYAYLKECIELMAEKEAEAVEQGEKAEVNNSKGEISELEQFLNEERERNRLEQEQAGIEPESEHENIVKEEGVEQEQEEEVGNQEKVSEEMVPNEEEIENQERKLEEELQSALPNESIESCKGEEIEEKNEEPQPHGIEENIEEPRNKLNEDDDKNEEYEQHQSKEQIEEEHDIELELIKEEYEFEPIKEEHEEKEEREELTKEEELSQISQELEVNREIYSTETEVLGNEQEEELEQDYSSPFRKKQREIEEYNDPQQELEEIELTAEIEHEALIEVEQEKEQEKEKADKDVEENYEKARKLYKQETGKRSIYSNKETKGFKQWLELKKESEEKQEHLQIEKDNSEVLKEESEQELDEGINPKLQPLLREIIENYNYLENLTTRFKELYKSAQNNQISKAEKNELKLLVNLLKKVGPNKFMLFASTKAIKRYSNKEKFSEKTNLNQALNHFFTKFMQNNLVFKNLKEVISPIEAELFEKFMQYTHETELIKNLVNEFNNSGNWIKNLRHTQTFINFVKQKRKLLENNSQNSSSNALKEQVEILSSYISLITKIKENNSLTKAIKNLILNNKGRFNAFNIERWLLITNNSARNQLKKMLTKEEYQAYVRTQKHVSIKTIEEIVKKKGGQCHTKQVKNAKSKLHIECAEGHSFYPSYESLVYQNTWCPESHIYVGEEICRQFCERIFKRPFPKSYPPWLVNRNGNQMELDGNSKEIKVAFEYQGIQHRKKAFGLSDDEVKTIQEEDDYRLKKCQENGVILLQIPDEEILPYEKMQNYIIQEYERISEKTLGNIPEYNWREFTIHENKHAKKFRAYIEEKGGTLLTSYFSAKKEVTILCEKGHQWTTTPDSIYKNNWCPECAGNKKGTTEKYQKIGAKFQCELLNEYINAKTPLQYKCQEGHVFKKYPYWLKKSYPKIEILCPECKMKTYAKKFQKFVRNKGGQVLTPYKGRFKPIKIKCKKEHEWEATPGATYQGRWCKTCASNKNLPNKKRQEAAKQEFLEKIKSYNYTLLSKYENSNKQVQIKCQRNHTFTMTPKYFKRLVNQKNEPCLKCRKNK